MIITDSIFEKGSSHQVCQDYSASVQDSAVGSDGCSSSMDTDVGARVLVHTLLGQLELDKDKLESSGEMILRNAMRSSVRTIGSMFLPDTALDATIFGFKVVGNKLLSLISGDGYIYKKYKDGYSSLISVDFSENMPFYPSYMTNSSRFLAYKEKENTVNVNLKILSQNPIENNTWTYSALNFFRFEVHDLEDLELFLMFSDGLATFQKTNRECPSVKEDVALLEILNKITNFKSYSQGFLQRKIINGLKKEYKGWELSHWDDFSVIGLANTD